MFTLIRSLSVLCACLGFVEARAAVALSEMFGSHMVLQREMPVPVWGTADPAEKITVTFREQKKTTVADAQGKWRVKLDPFALGEPATLTVAGTNTLTLTDVLVGEVWVGSGQSNIDSPVTMYVAQDPVLKAASGENHPQLRLFHLPRKNGWKEARPDDKASYAEQTVPRFSAQLFYFGVMLQRELGVPVGVIQAAKGGMASAVFISQEGFNADTDIQAAVTKWDQANPLDVQQKRYDAALAKWKTDLEAALAAAPADAASTAAIRKKYPEPKPPARAADAKTGAQFELIVRPMISYAIRGVLWDQGESYSGLQHGIGQTLVMPALIRSWRKDWGQGDFPWIYVQKQNGGGCALNPEDPVNLGAKAFEALPKEPPARGYQSAEGYSSTNPANTWLSITTDLVPGVHPINKSGYATRASRVALGAVYGRPLEYYGPVFASFKVEGGKVRIFYTHVGKGLTVPANQKLQGFAIAGADKKFQWADAVIDGDTVVLSSPAVPAPVAARYWPFAWANLFNRDGLPAGGFQTDDWK